MAIKTESNAERSSLVEALVTGNGKRARSVIDEVLARNRPPAYIAVDLVLASMREIGDLWHAGEVSVAQEHHATQMAFDLLDILRQECVRKPPIGMRALVAAVEGEQHILGARLTSDLLYQDGWDVDFLGADLPAEEIVRYAEQRQSSLIVLSCTIRENLGAMLRTLTMLRQLPDGGLRTPAIVVGGAAVYRDDAAEVRALANLVVDDLHDLATEIRDLVGAARGQTLEQYLAVIGTNLQALRKRKGWSQASLADGSGLDRTYISALERGRQNVSLGALIKLAEALDCDVATLMLPDSGAKS